MRNVTFPSPRPSPAILSFGSRPCRKPVAHTHILDEHELCYSRQMGTNSLTTPVIGAFPATVWGDVANMAAAQPNNQETWGLAPFLISELRVSIQRVQHLLPALTTGVLV